MAENESVTSILEGLEEPAALRRLPENRLQAVA
ncbi:hypothetical protein QO017_005622, partial [Methylobacterium gregans]|nr:hypothetical protein [Methylobacterium gregans]